MQKLTMQRLRPMTRKKHNEHAGEDEEEEQRYLSFIEYALGQEGLSRRTFGKLIREKFGRRMSWDEATLSEMYRIVNRQSNASSNHLDPPSGQEFKSEKERIDSYANNR